MPNAAVVVRAPAAAPKGNARVKLEYIFAHQDADDQRNRRHYDSGKEKAHSRLFQSGNKAWAGADAYYRDECRETDIIENPECRPRNAAECPVH